MRKALKRLALFSLSGAILLQSPGCVETALGISTLAQVVTAGGVMYLVARVLE